MPTPTIEEHRWLAGRSVTCPPFKSHLTDTKQNTPTCKMLAYTYFVVACCSNFSPTDKKKSPRLRMFSGKMCSLAVLQRIHKALMFVIVNVLIMNYATITDNTTRSPRTSPPHCQNSQIVKIINQYLDPGL